MIDLHTHSLYSDGTMSPLELVDYAADHGVNTLALTDHDTVAGVSECMSIALSKGMNFISGIELSVNWSNKVIHVVGLGIDIKNRNLLNLIDKQQLMRDERARNIAIQLEESMGLKNGYNKACEIATGGLIARPHFAKILIQEGYCKDMKTAFTKYLKRGRSGYVRTQWVDLRECIATIVNSGGVAVLAHPKRYKFTRTKLLELLIDFKEVGGKAIEVIAGMASNDEVSYLSSLCNKFDLLASVGSDFHGKDLTPYSMKRLRALPEQCKSIMQILQ